MEIPRLGRKQVILLILFIAILVRALISPMPFDNNYNLHPDYYVHLLRIEVIKEYGYVPWDSFNFGGAPFLKFYPPLGSYLAAALPLNAIDSYKLVLFLSFILTPITILLLLKEFKLDLHQLVLGTLLISFTPRFAEILFYQNYGTTLAIPIGLLFLKFFIKAHKYNSIKNATIAAVLLGMTALTHTAVLVGVLMLSFTYIVSDLIKNKEYRKLRSDSLIFAGGFLISSIYTIPLLLEFQFSSYGSGIAKNVSSLFLTPVVFFIKTFSHFTNYTVLLLGLLTAIFVLYAIVKRIAKKDIVGFEILALLMFFVLSFIMTPIADTERSATFYIIPIALLLVKNSNKKLLYITIVAMIGLESLYFVNVMTPFDVDINGEKAIISDIASMDGRAIIIPTQVYNSSLFYLLGKENIQNGGGSLWQGLYNIEFNSPTGSYEVDRVGFAERLRLFNCYNKISLDEMLKETGLFTKSSTTEPSECMLTNPNFKEDFRLQNIKRIIVFKNSPAISLFENDPGFNVLGEEGNLKAFYFNSGSGFVDTNINYTYQRTKLNRIDIILQSTDKVQNVSVRVSETWYPFWRSDEVNIVPDKDGFITFVVPEVDGTKKISLEFNNPEFYNYLPFVSLLTAIAFPFLYKKLVKVEN